MEAVVGSIAAILAVAVVILILMLRRTTRSATVRSEAVELVPSAPVEPSARGDLVVVANTAGSQLVLGDVPLLALERWVPASGVEPVPLTSTFSTWIGTMLDNPRVLEYIAGERYVLAKVPDAIRAGGKWLESGGVQKAVARGPKGQFAGIADLVRGGAATGAAVALGPAILGAVAVAYAHHEITAGLDRIEGRIDDLERRMQAADLGIIDGSRRLLREMEEWGPPHLWPEQLRWELAVRRAALDPVCFTQRAAFDRLTSAMSKNGTTFKGLDADDRKELERTLETLSLAIMTRAQIGFATTMVLLDSDHAPFGLERLNRLTQDFVDEMTQIIDALQTVLDGERPGRIGTIKNQLLFINRRKNTPTEQLVAELMASIAEVTNAISGNDDRAVVLSVRDGELQISTPPLELGPGDKATDAAALKAELDATAANEARAALPVERTK